MNILRVLKKLPIGSIQTLEEGFSVAGSVLPRQERQTIFARTVHIKTGEKVSNASDSDVPLRPNVASSEDAAETMRLQKIRRAMRTYYKNYQEEAGKRAEKVHEFEAGRRHLANMMGADPNTFTQRHIDRAIEYLMPSGLFETRARPIMKHPDEIDPPKKGYEIDETGRPLNTFFYTGRASFYTIFYNITNQFQELDKYEDKMITKGFAKPPPETKISLKDSEWITLEATRKMVDDKNLPESEYKYLIESLERLVQHPYSFRIKDFFMKYRVPKKGVNIDVDILPLTVGEDGIPFAKATGSRKWTRAHVTVKGKGTGQVNINKQDISYFTNKQEREQLLFPLKFTGLLNQVDIEVRLSGPGGDNAEAGAIRHGISLALTSFVSPEMAEKMRLAGLTGKDVRRRERKKPGQRGARAKFKWVKR